MTGAAASDPQALLRQIRAARRAGQAAEALALLARAPDPADHDWRIERGYALLELGRAGEAETVFEALRREAPGHAEVLVGLGRCRRQRGDFAAALAVFEVAQAADPRHLGARLDVANALFELGRLDAAEAHYAAVLADHPQQPNALLWLGRLARRRGDRQAALDHTEAALAMLPHHTGARLDTAQDLIELGRPDAAAAAFEAVLADAPEHVDALLGLGRLARGRGRAGEALAWFRRALAAHPAHLGARLDVAYGLYDGGEWTEAEALFRAVLNDLPKQVGALLGLARIARQRGERAAARAWLEQAVAADPAHAGARLELAGDLREWGEYEAAQAAIDAVLQARPDHAEALLQRGALQRQTGEFAAALATFETAAACQPGAARPLLEAAQTARALGRPEAAAAWLARALALDPGNVETLGQQADLAWLAEDFPGCLALCEQALAGQPGRSWPYVLGARSLAALGRQDEALALLGRAALAGTAAADILAARIEVFKRAGDWPAVRAALAGAPDLVARHFRLWVEQVQCDLAHGELAAAAAALPAAPCASIRDLARVTMLRGQIAEAQWRLDEALTQYREAVRLSPLDPGMTNDLARVCLLRLDLAEAGRLNARSLQLEATAAKLRGRSLRPAQSHLGQVLDEFRMDRAAAARLAALLALPPGQRVARLRALVAADPGHTPTAIQLVLALRQAGAFDRTRPAMPHAGSLPLRIVQFWDTPEPPADVAATMRDWQTRNPDWEYVRFDAPGAFAFLRAHYGPAVAAAFRRAGHPASQADLFRLAYLFRHGGVYADADDRCIGPLEALLPVGTTFLSWQEGYSTLANNLLGAAPGHPVIGRALAGAVAALNRRDSDSLWLATGPGLLTRAFAAELAETNLRVAEWLRGVAVLTPGALPRAVAVHCFAQYKTTEKHWNRHEFGTKGAKARGAAAAPA